MNEVVHLKTILYTVSVLLIFAWAIGFFVYSLKPSVHFLLISAAIIGILGNFRKS
ncbi:MAG: lmo0937 family membrane protein [Aquaticitalea sp.]